MNDFTDNTYTVLYSDDDIVVVSKAHGLHVIPDRYGAEKTTLTRELSLEFGKLFVVHRLDAGTGGLVVFARNAPAHAFLCAQFESRAVEKEYLAIASHRFANQTLMLPIAKANHGKFKINFKSGKQAITSFIELSTNGKQSIVRAIPATGRSHQIRVHLKALKAPLYLDWVYNEPISEHRLSLFAYSIKFAHPKTKENVSFKTQISDFMKDIAQKLELSIENV